ncbi:hypothetical protein EK21DRAFT_89142 [Setomelanomma holmii]|uniref:Uncharacterized protein n=1 Tax=Setomelanomma holmii TaxID=210430 RepID=A0A9P4HBA9_9PLEO|nr:hypothetical protein EK21DRAFT_89142 [Setomelanomma holmii]
MSTLSKLAADIEAESKSANIRPLASVVGEPQLVEPFAAETGSSGKGANKAQINLRTTTEAKLATQDTTSFQTWQTRMKLFLLSTGDDNGSNSEIRVTAGIQGYPIAKASIDLPKNSSWTIENDGLGHELAHQVRNVVGALLLTFGGYVDGTDSIGSNGILFIGIDFTKPEWIRYADGGACYMTSKNSGDAGYVAVI